MSQSETPAAVLIRVRKHRARKRLERTGSATPMPVAERVRKAAAALWAKRREKRVA